MYNRNLWRIKECLQIPLTRELGKDTINWIMYCDSHGSWCDLEREEENMHSHGLVCMWTPFTRSSVLYVNIEAAKADGKVTLNTTS